MLHYIMLCYITLYYIILYYIILYYIMVLGLAGFVLWDFRLSHYLKYLSGFFRVPGCGASTLAIANGWMIGFTSAQQDPESRSQPKTTLTLKTKQRRPHPVETMRSQQVATNKSSPLHQQTATSKSHLPRYSQPNYFNRDSNFRDLPEQTQDLATINAEAADTHTISKPGTRFYVCFCSITSGRRLLTTGWRQSYDTKHASEVIGFRVRRHWVCLGFNCRMRHG